MKKIVLAVDATPININSLDFACYMAKLTNSTLTGIFLENVIGEPAPALKTMYGTPYVETIAIADVPENAIRVNQSEKNIKRFEEACANKGIMGHVHRDKGVPIEEVITETRFSDLLITDAHITLANRTEGMLTPFLKEVLSKSECPVIIAPYSFTGVDEIVFAYDGSASSVYAIKQFTYLFPELSRHKILVLQVDAKEDMPVIEREKIVELLQMHYRDIQFLHLQGNATDELFGYLLEKENMFVVMGAFGRTMLSGFFRHSTAELLAKTVNLPLFITHQ